MSQLPFMPMEWSSFFAKTAHLTNEARWAYCEIMARTWLNNGSPYMDDDRVLARLTNLPLRRWRVVRKEIEHFFDLSKDTWRQVRVEKDFALVTEKREKNRVSGGAGGRSKASNKRGGGLANASHSLQQNASERSSEPPSKDKFKDKQESSSLRSYDLGNRDALMSASASAPFAVWYSVYPHKVGQRTAFAAYAAALDRGATPDELLAGLQRYIANKPASYQWSSPAKWLEGDRWLDQPAVVNVRSEREQSPVSTLYEGAFRAAENFERRIAAEGSGGDGNSPTVPLLDDGRPRRNAHGAD